MSWCIGTTFICVYQSHDLSVGTGSLSHDVSGTTGDPIASKVEWVTLNIWIHYFSVNSWTVTSQEALIRGLSCIQGACLSGRAPPTCICCLRFAPMTPSAVVAMGISLPTFRTSNDDARGENVFVVATLFSGNTAFPQLCFECQKHCLSFQLSYNIFWKGVNTKCPEAAPGSDVFKMSVITSDSTLEHVFIIIIIIRQPETFRQLSNIHSQ